MNKELKWTDEYVELVAFYTKSRNGLVYVETIVKGKQDDVHGKYICQHVRQICKVGKGKIICI